LLVVQRSLPACADAFFLINSVHNSNQEYCLCGFTWAMNPSPKLYALEFKEHPEYLHARITASFLDRTGALSYLSEIFLECAKLRKKRLLLERATPCMMQRDELYSTMDYIVSVEKDTHIAFLNAHGTVAETLSHIVDYGTEQGGRFRYFQEFKEAENWLLEDGKL